MSDLARQIMRESGVLPPPPENEGDPGGGETVHTPAVVAGTETPAKPIAATPAKPVAAGSPAETPTPAVTPVVAPAVKKEDEEEGRKKEGKEETTEIPNTEVKKDPATPAEKPTPILGAELSDDELMQALKKRGVNANSIEELKPRQIDPTEAELAAKAEEEHTKAITYGLENKLFKSADLEAYTRDKDRPVRDRALEVFAKVVRKDNAELTDEEVDDQFSDYFGENLEEGSFRRNMMAKEMDRLGDIYLQNKYAGIINSPDAYRTATQVEAQVRQYRTEVEETFAEFPAQLSFTIEGHEYQFAPNKETLKTLKEEFLSENSFDAYGSKAPGKELLNSAVKNALLAKDHTRMIEVLAKAHSDRIMLENQAGRIGIVPKRDGDGNEQQDVGSTYQGFAKSIINQK